MSIFKTVKKAVKRIMGDEQQLQEDQAQAKLEKWKRKLTDAMSNHDSFRSDAARWDDQYHGTKAVGQNMGRVYKVDGQTYISDRSGPGTPADARQVVNITFQLIESQIDISVPQPTVEATEDDGNNERKDMIEGQLKYMADDTVLKRIVSENERIAKKNSLCVYKVSYNPDYRAHKWTGQIETTNPHPVNVIPQPGVFRIKDMDHMFHIENRTIDYVCRRYGEQFRPLLENESPEYAELDQLGEMLSTASTDKGKVSVVECWHKDKDDDVSLLTWANAVTLKDMPKFFYRRDEQGSIIEFDDLEIMVGVDELGEPITELIRVPCHVPKQFPFVIQYNIPREKSYYGKSDPDVIYDQQEGIKKVLSIEEEKQIKGTTKVFVRKDLGIKDKLTNAVTQIIDVDDPQADVRVVDLKTPDNALKDLYGIYVQAAKDALGVTEASQGRSEGSTLSGRALDILANNTAGRISTKIFEKTIAFTEMYQLYFDFLLAFYNEPRPYRIEGPDNKPAYGYFDKAKLVKQDAAGEWYYPEFDIYISVDTGLPKDKRFIMESANAGAGKTLDPIEYWMVMESIGFPNATTILEREQEKQAKAEQMAAQQAEIAQPTTLANMGGGQDAVQV